MILSVFTILFIFLFLNIADRSFSYTDSDEQQISATIVGTCAGFRFYTP